MEWSYTYKVNKAGNSYKITLPPAFIKEFGVKKGDSLHVRYDPNLGMVVVSKNKL